MDKVFDLIKQEEARQENTIMMIPSENYASENVRLASGSVLANKYSEGYAGRRYYQGNEFIDQIELLAIERAKKLFGVNFVNVQPYSGSPANSAVQMAVVEPGETIVGLSLSGGGHLTHGHPKITFSGKYYNSVQYDVDENGWIDYEQVEKIVSENKPKLVIVGTTAYPRILNFAKFRQIADSVGAYLLADISHIAGLVVGGVHPSPVGIADVVTTTTHKTLRGPRGAMIMTNNEELAKKIDKAVFPGLQGGPHNATTAAIAVALAEADTEEFKKYAAQIVKNAQVLAGELTSYEVQLVTGGTDNHLLVMDVRKFNMLGKEAAVKLEQAGIVANANAIAHDPNPPMKPSGVRLGTPAVTTRGMKEAEMKQIGKWIVGVLDGNLDAQDVAKEVEVLCKKFKI